MEEAEKLMVVICDVNPKHWLKIDAHDNSSDNKNTFQKCMESLMVFCNSYLMFNHSNRLAFIACHTTECPFLYPPPEDHEEEQTGFKDGKFELFVEFNSIITRHIKNLLSDQENNHTSTEPKQTEQNSLLSGAFSKALCYIHRNSKNGMGNKVDARIFILKASPDVPSQYMPIMNCIFASQKNDIMIDSCSVNFTSGFLQQAADITNGTYTQVDNISGLLEYLIWMFLPEQEMRKTLQMPSSVEIDYRAACFCHKQLVDIGFVCSICLSIYCQFMPRCLTCQTRFKLPHLPAVKPKKKKK